LGIGDWGLGPIPNPQSPILESYMIKFLMHINILINIFLIYYKNKNKFE